jgi:hypothetical protein
VRKRLPAESREFEQPVDHGAHRLDARLDPLQRMTGIVGQVASQLVFDDRGEAVDRAQRDAQVVRDGVAERFELEGVSSSV